MTGIMEQILAEQQKTNQLLAAIANLGGGTAATVPATTTAAVTSEMITELVTPYLSGPTEAAARTKFKAVMAQHGVDGLGNARPDQWPALYSGFKAAITEGFAAPAGGGII